MRALAVVCALGLIVGCVQDGLVPCGDLLCPVESTCIAGACITDAQVAACLDQPPEIECSTVDLARGFCLDGVCQASICGDGIQQFHEECDDDNVSSGDGCSGDCQSTEICGNGYIDGVAGEQCDVGLANLSGDGCSSTCTVETDAWTNVTPRGPSGRIAPSSAYDEARGRHVMFGGHDGEPSAETWEWDGQNWELRTPAVSPPRRAAATMTYDVERRRTILFGGISDTAFLADTWAWDGVTWTELHPSTSPSARVFAASAYDRVRKQVILVGGVDTMEQLPRETWAWDGATWTLASTTGPTGRSGTAIAWHPGRQRLVLFGGSTSSDFLGASRETWEWSGTAWTLVNSSGPNARSFHQLEVDPATQHLFVFGGFTSTGLYLTDPWRWTGTAWIVDSTTGLPPARSRFTMTYDPQRNITRMTGGIDPNGIVASTWQRSTTGWSQPPSSLVPFPFDIEGVVYERLRGTVMMLGHGGASTTLQQWRWNGATWAPVTASLPSRGGAAVVYDEAREQVVLFGGRLQADSTYVNETWTWDGTSWTRAMPAMSPSPRTNAALGYDANRREVVLLGGDTEMVSGLTDTWTWNGATWRKHTPSVSPPNVSRRGMVFDRSRGRLVMVVADSVVWEWDGTTWSSPVPVVQAPPTHTHQIVYDPARRRVLKIGGYNNATAQPTNQVWEWDGVTWEKRTPVTTTVTRANGAAVYDAARNRVLMFGGANPMTTHADTWSYQWDAPSVSPELCLADRDTDGDLAVGCADPDCIGRCAPTCALGEPCALDEPRCGDAACSVLEDHVLCPDDCPIP